MTPEQWQKVEDVLQGALDRAPHERASFLDEACGGDEQLQEEATSLVNAYEQAGDFIEQPAIVHDARVLVGEDVASRIGSEIGPYKIVERLGVGGMGEVYLAQDARLDRLVALKILPAYFAADDARLRRFQREARAASALNHPNILTIHEIGESAFLPYISTEFIDGVTIRELVSSAELSLTEVLDIAEQVASALAAAHAAGIVHRDIKPENIMRRRDGLVKILDFGIAKLMEPETADDFGEAQLGATTPTRTEAGLIMGTVNYMSPEQARGLPVDERTDIWSLGVVLYEMLALRRPFTAATRIDTMVGILEREPAPLCEVVADRQRASPRLQQIVNRCLRKEMTDRYRTANELLAELKRLTEDPNVPAGLITPGLMAASLENRAPATRADENSAATTSHGRYTWTRIMLGVAVLLIAALAASVYYRRAGVGPSSSIPNAANIPNAAQATTARLYSQMSEAERLKFVDEQEQRISTMMGDRPVKLGDDAVRVIKAYVDHYAAPAGASGLDSDSMSIVCERARPYVPLIARSFAERKVPVIIGIYLPVIESAYRNCFENSVGAKGLFQFLPQTAESYGVARRDMCDVEKMTPAAAHYLADRMAELGEDSQSMTLVLLSYNRGQEWVRNTLRELRGTENYERNFWTLLAHRETLDQTFQNENAAYVPRFFAAAIIGENPETFGLPTPPLSSLAREQ